MKPLAIEAAQGRLERARRALKDFADAKSYRDAESAWVDFLIAASAIFAKLEQGSKGYGKSSAWYGRTKAARKSDPVMHYLHMARNCEEHGIELVTERHVDGGFNLAFGERQEFTIQTRDELTGALGEPERAWAYGPHVKLTRAHNRNFGDFCDPPYSSINPPGDPNAVGEYALEKLAALIGEAEKFVEVSA